MQAEAQQQEEFEETTSVELEDDSAEEIVEDSQEASADEETRTNVQVDDDDQELRDYESPNKKRNDPEKRIRQLTRARKQAEEDAAAAIEYAKQDLAQNEDYKKRLSTVNTGYMSEYEGRIASQETQAKRALAEAHEAGDYEKVADAQTAIAQIAIEKERLRLQRARTEQDTSQEVEVEQPQQQQQPQPQQQQQRDPKLESWLSKNTWFGSDKVMTGAARALHETLVAEEGFDPRTDEYYAEIDNDAERCLTSFGLTRKTSKLSRLQGQNTLTKIWTEKIRTKPGQVALAQKLNIPLEKYAAEVAKLKIGETDMADRTSHETQTRERQERRVWRPGSALEAPEAPLGYTHRWIRESVMEFDDKTNVHKRRQEGYELVRAEEYPDYSGPVVDEGRNAGIIGVGGLVLARIPTELAAQRNQHYQGVTSNQMEAVDRDWMRENNPAMPKMAPQRKTSVSFGGPKNSEG